MLYCCFHFFFFKQKTAYEMRISDWSSDVCSSDLPSTACRRRCRPQNAPPPLRHSSRRPGLLLQSSWPKSPWSPRRFLSVHSLRLRRRRSEEHTSELQSLMRISYAVFCLKKKTNIITAIIKHNKHPKQHTHRVKTSLLDNHIIN